MPRVARPWFRFYVEAFADRKIRRIPAAQRWAWAAVLGAARESPQPGRLLIADGVPMSVRELADYADMREKDVRAALDVMCALGMVSVEDGVIVVRKFNDRQFESDNVSARTHAHRERSKERSNAVPKNVRRNTPDTETETETDTEEPKNGSSVGARKRADDQRGSRLPDDWRPSRELVAEMRNEGIPDEMARRELPRFCDYWRSVPGAKGRKLDWSLTWRNWLRRANDENPIPAQRTSGDPATAWMRGDV